MTAKARTLAQVAELYQVDYDTAHGWVASGALRAINVGKGSIKPRYRIMPDALAEFERARTVSPPPPRPRCRRKRRPQVYEYF
jgi:hypothetical protein